MSKEMAVIAIGVWVVIIPYLGVPGSWRTVILVVTGIAIALLGFWLRGEAITRRTGATQTDEHPFVERTAARHPDSHDHIQDIARS